MKQEWKKRKIGDIGNIFSGNSINSKVKSEKYVNLNVGEPYIATKDISYNHHVDYENGVRIPNNELGKFRVAHKNSILICIEGGSAGRKFALISQDVCFVNKLLALEPFNFVEPRFVFYFYQSKYFRNQFYSQITGLIGGVSIGKFKNLKIPIPSISEQKRIVKILDEAFLSMNQLNHNVERNITNLNEIFESYLDGIFSNSSNEWSTKKLKEICEKITDGVHKKPRYVKSGVPFIKISDLTSGPGISFNNVSYITRKDHEDFCKRTKPEKGDILITKDGTIGVVRVVDTDIEFSIFVSVALIKPISKKITPYLKYLLMSPIIQNQIKPKGAALKHLYLKDLREYDIPIAPLNDQVKIVSRLNELHANLLKLELSYRDKVKKLNNLKKSILQKAFNGELAGA